MILKCDYLFLFILSRSFSTILVSASVSYYVNNLIGYLGYGHSNQDNDNLAVDEFTHRIPYEVNVVDDKFISEATKLTGVALSELDSCQHRVVLKLTTDCNKLNDEQLAKMAVQLLNCQSYVEGRKIFPCTDEMSIKQCTINMDSDTWTSYHLMSNRARAVCYMIRQTQFRGLAEQTVNRLMAASKEQLSSLGKIVHNQENIKTLTENTYDSLTKAQRQLSEQQEDMQKAQFHGQLLLESNIMRLVDEKRLVHETHEKLIEMTREVHNKLENSVKLIEDQNDQSHNNHKDLLEDIALIQAKTANLFKKIDDYSDILFQQNEDFKNQYEATLKNLQEVNKTVHNLVNLLGVTRQTLEERLSWIVKALGGTDQAVVRLYLMLWHMGFILIAMLICAFLSARNSTRIIVASLPPINLSAALCGTDYMDFLTLLSVTIALVAGQALFIYAYRLKSSKQQIIREATHMSKLPSEEKDITKQWEESNHEDPDQFNEEFSPVTPPISRIGRYSLSHSRSNTPISYFKRSCGAQTRAGTPCKLTSAPGRDYCYRHQNGDSIMG